MIHVAAPSASVATLKMMLDYLYNHGYDDSYRNEIQPSSVNTDGEEDDPASPSSKPSDHQGKSSTTDELTSRLMTNLHVYALGDFYNIPHLKDLAHHKFISYLDDSAEVGWAELVAEVYEHTPDGDRLRMALVYHLSHRHYDFCKDRAILERTSTISDFMMDFTIAASEANVQEIGELNKATLSAISGEPDASARLSEQASELGELREEKRVLQKEKTELRVQGDNAKSDLTRITGQFDRLKAANMSAGYERYCSACNEMVQAQIERCPGGSYNSEFKLRIVCRQCAEVGKVTELTQ